MSNLTPKQQRFVAEYLVDLNATQAATRAGYSARTAEQQGYQLLKKTSVAQAIAAAQQERARRTQITADRVLLELGRLAFFDIRRLYDQDGRLKAPHELDDDTAAALASVEIFEEFSGRGEDREQIGETKKVKSWDKKGSLELAMRHLGMMKDKLEHTGPDGGPIQYQKIERVVVDPK